MTFIEKKISEKYNPEFQKLISELIELQDDLYLFFEEQFKNNVLIILDIMPNNNWKMTDTNNEGSDYVNKYYKMQIIH